MTVVRQDEVDPDSSQAGRDSTDTMGGAGVTGSVREAGRWMTRRPCYGGIIGALIFFALSMTPSLLPRAWTWQGVVSGLTGAIGYGIGSAISALARRLHAPEPTPETKRRAWIGLAAATPVVLAASLCAGSIWDGHLRRLMEMPLEEPWKWLGVVVVATIAATILLLVARVFRGLGHLLVLLVNHLLPRPYAIAVGGVVAAAIVVFVVIGGMAEAIFRSMDATAAVWDATVQPDIDPPTSPLRSGGPESLIAWEDLGSKGREFTAEGPTVDDLTAFADGPAMQPIRVYGGLSIADSLDERVEIVMQELERTGAFERSVLIVQTPSGNGEVGSINLAAPEYMFAGDTAQVALQYGYAGSFATMVTKPGAGQDSATALIDAVYDRLQEIPDGDRPRFYVAGESLGSLSTEAAFEDLDDLVDRTDGALMVGPTLFNDIRDEVIEGRDEGSHVWRPVLDDGSTVRFAQNPDDLHVPSGEWGETRVVYLSNASDPVAWYDLRMTFNRPEFLDDPRGPDVSEDMIYVPVLTFWQVLTDLPFASKAPLGHGHRYKVNIVDGWAAVLQPPDWTGNDTQRLRAVFED